MTTEGTDSTESKKWEWDPVRKYRYPLRAKEDKSLESSASLKIVSAIDGSMTEACIEPGWRISDILLAARVLQKDHPPPRYTDEAEMRRVFGLVYDVLRYKNILNRALEDVGFWYRNKSLKSKERIVWLILYDLQGRKFARRGSIADLKERERVFRKAGLKEIEDALLATKTHLAACVSRLRIGGSALSLDELLPVHLRLIEGVTWRDGASIASGWVNSVKVRTKAEFTEEMSRLGFVCCEDCEVAELNETQYTFDPLCPKIVNLHDKAREKLAVSSLVREHRFVFLERSMCLGAAILAHAIRGGRFCGPVVLTHCIAPRHTGYLAELLADIEDAGRLLAFGAGERRYEYETYLSSLGVTLQRCRVFSEKYTSAPASPELERATVVLAVPPCSYTGVKDIVDLAVARGGDTELLESVTSVSTNSEEMKQPRALLADQLTTLKLALTRPNVQFLIYEAHTILPSETTEMVKQVVDYANQMAMEKYIREHPPKKKGTKEGSGKQAKLAKMGKTFESQEDLSSLTSVDVTVPDSDLFEVGSIEDIYGTGSDRMMDPGCFLAVIKRKEMMQFNSLFMIKVAESKGLFGDPNESPKVKQEPTPVPVRRPSQSSRREMKRAKIEIERIMAPTHSTLIRSTKENQICPRHMRYDAQRERMTMTQVQEARKRYAFRWWRNTAASVAVDGLEKADESSRFKFPRIDPVTLRILYPWHVETLPSDYNDPRKQDNTFRVSEDPENDRTNDESSYESYVAFRDRQRESVKRLSRPKHRVIPKVYRTVGALDEREQDSSYFTGPDYRTDISDGEAVVADSSTALRRNELIRAVQFIPSDLGTEQRRGNVSEFLWDDWQRTPARRASRVHHPGGFIDRAHLRDLTSTIPTDFPTLSFDDL